MYYIQLMSKFMYLLINSIHVDSFILLLYIYIYISNGERTTLISTKFAILSFFHQLTQYWLIAMVGRNITLEDGDVI